MIRGALFSSYYLEDGIRDTQSYRTLNPVQLTAFADTARGRWRTLATMRRPSEAETESEFIFPILDKLGWHHLPQQEPGHSRRDIADALLFLTAAAKSRARSLPKPDRFKHGVVVVENEARDTPLDRASGTKEAPSSQILRYLSRADSQSDGAVSWGLLTTGGLWRLYWAKARDRAKDFIEIDFAGLIGDMPPPVPAGASSDHWLRVFLLLFHRDAFEPHGPQAKNFLDDAVAEGRRYEARVTAQLSEAVFDKVFPALVAAIARHDAAADPQNAAWRSEAREGALRLLYRLLFLLYAEDRDLLPVRHPGYTDYSLLHFRSEAAAVADQHKTLSSRAVSWWPKLLIDDPDPAAEAGREAFFGGNYCDPVAIAAGAALKAPRSDAAAIVRKRGKLPISAADAHAAATRFVERARALAAERRFMHWEAAFPGVWDEWERQPPIGGFDAVIGNPPWDRMKMQEVEWFAARVPQVALNPRASHRKAAVQALRRERDPIAAEYDHAAWTAEAAIRVARDSGQYPLLSGGDVNIYALMVERAARIIKPDGIVGLLVPSGIAADLGAAPFFRSISTTGRLAALLDFENRRISLKLPPFFPDVDSRFKFCSLTFGGENRVFPSAECAFFNESAVAAEQNAFALAPADFDAVNPNTGTAPIFRTQRDAAITRAIYARLPVLVDRRQTPPAQVWPVRYCTMFHMTNDSGKFRTEAELRKLGAYEVASGGWEKGEAKWLPLYEGKMVQGFDHRAASIVVNADNIHRPAQPQPTGDLLHASAKHLSKTAVLDKRWRRSNHIFAHKRARVQGCNGANQLSDDDCCNHPSRCMRQHASAVVA